MSKYRGKHHKSQDCIHVIRQNMVTVVVDDKCPESYLLSCGVRLADKADCDDCTAYQKGANAMIDTALRRLAEEAILAREKFNKCDRNNFRQVETLANISNKALSQFKSEIAPAATIALLNRLDAAEKVCEVAAENVCENLPETRLERALCGTLCAGKWLKVCLALNEWRKAKEGAHNNG